METNQGTEMQTEMKYSEFLQAVIDLIPEYYNWLSGEEYSTLKDNKIYLCNHLNYIADHKPEISKAHIKKLRDTIKRKLNGDSTLGRKIGFNTEARIRWLESLILIYKAKGK